ncbi:unnamed protein product [Rhizophagus irregularis]|nr:unnamed protein product [Rhizophagus irregularis]
MEEPSQPQGDIRGKSRGNGHYEATCSFCNKKWSRGKPASLRAHIANHCTATNIPANVQSYFIQVVANENENKREYYSSDNEAETSACPAKINNHFQKKEKLNSNRINEIDCGLVRAFICCGIPFWIIENPLIINLLKSLNANYDPPSRICLTETLLETEVAKVNARVDRIIERNENFTIEQENLNETNSNSFVDNVMDPKSFIDNDMDPKSFIDDETDESDRPDEPSDSLELTSGLTFTDWEDFKSWLHRFASKEGFSYKIRTSETIQGVMRRATYECAKSGSHNPQTTSDPTKQRNAHSQRTLCPWKLNVTRLKTRVVKVNSFNNEHNHPLIPMIQEIAPRFQKLTKEMLADIENTKNSWAVPWIRNRFTAGAQSTQRIESINSHMHGKVDHFTSLCNLLVSINDHVKNDEHFEQFEIERDALPTVGMPMLNTRFFSQVDVIIKEFLTPTMLGKQRSQMNQSVCYNISQITDWRHLMEIETDNEEISIGIREQEQDTRQILLRSLVSTIPMEAILEVWNVRATGTRGIGHYVILLNEGTHLCTCLLLINKGLVCQHFFRVGTYSRFATFHICMIPNRWYINPDVEPNDLLQQYTFIPVCDKIQSEDNIPFKNPITFQHFFSIRIDSHGSQPSQPAVNSPKAMYAELAGLSKKAIDCALKSDKQQELLNIFKAFIYDVKSELEPENFTDVINPVVIKHKGRPPKRLISSVEKGLNREKRVLKDVSNSNVIEDNNTSNIVEDFTNDTKGRKCSKCKQYGHYAKTCQNVI